VISGEPEDRSYTEGDQVGPVYAEPDKQELELLLGEKVVTTEVWA